LVLAGLSFYDFFKARRGEFSKLKLKLPALLKDQIHRSVRRNATLGGWILGSFITGGLVSVLELACTGQVYLPTIIFVAQFPQLRAHAISYLIIYNLCFILPLVGVFILAYLGFSSQKSQQWFARHISAVKFATGCLFLILGGFLFSSLLI
jgi:cytochrome c biogenesis protein CcdA